MIPKFSKTELKQILITIFVLTFVFAFDDKQPTFNLQFWLNNFFLTLIWSSIVVITHQLGHKIMGLRYKVHTEHRTWTIKRFWIATQAKFKLVIPFTKKEVALPIGIILAILTTLISKGKVYFAAIETFISKEHPSLRLGHRWSNLPEFELSIIALSGPLTNIFLALILASFNHNNIFSRLILISYVYGLTAMVPISNLDGCKIFFSSKTLYILSLIFMISCIILINILTIIQTLILSSIFAAMIAIIFTFKLLS